MKKRNRSGCLTCQKTDEFWVCGLVAAVMLLEHGTEIV